MLRPRAPRGAEHGLTLVECLAALALLALVVTMSFTVLERHRKFLERMDARLLATRAAEFELETLLASPFGSLEPRTTRPVSSPPPELARLGGSTMTVLVAETDLPSLRRVRVEIHWREDGGRSAVAEALIHGGAGGHP